MKIRQLMRRLRAAPVRPLQVLRLEPGDILVVGYEGRMSMQQLQNLREAVNAHLPQHKVLVLSEGMTVAAVRPAALQEVHAS